MGIVSKGNERNLHAGVLMIIPEYYGLLGGSTNERQLALFLSGEFQRTYIFSVDLLRDSLAKRCSHQEGGRPLIVSLPAISSPVLTDLLMIFYSFVFAFFAAFLKKTGRIDIVYVRGSLLAVGVCALRSALNLKPIALKFAAFASDYIDPRTYFGQIGQALFNAIDVYTLSRSDLVIVHSNEMKQDIQRRCFLGDKAFAIAPPGVDLDKIRAVAAKDRARNDRFRIGFLGNVNRWQGVDILIDAASKVQQFFPNILLYIVGYGKSLEEIERTARERGIELVATGPVPHNVALAYLSTFDVLVIPRRRTLSTKTNLPMKMLEALALGVPIIVTRDEIMLNMFNDSDVLFAEPDSLDVSEKICFLLSNPDLRRKMKENGPISARRFSYRRIAQELCCSFSEFMS